MSLRQIASAGGLLLATAYMIPSAAAQDWFVYAQTGARAYSSDGSGGSSSSDIECNGPAHTCDPEPGYVPRHSPTNPVAESSSSANGYIDFDHGGPSETLATAYGKADLTRGELKIFQSAAGGRNELTSSATLSQFSDNLTFDLTGYSSPIPITIDLRVDGSFEGYTQPRYAFYIDDSLGTLSTGAVGWADNNPFGPSTTADANFIDFDGRSGDWSVYGPDHFVGTFWLDPSHPQVYLAMSLSAGGSTEYGDTYTAFDHTAAINLQLPPGLTFTSASGVFLSGLSDGNALPEPAAWAMMIAGFGLIGSAMRRRRLPTLGRARLSRGTH